MQNEKNPKNKKNLKPAAVILAVTLLVISAVGGTLAWLTSTPDAVTNTFTIGNIDIALAETTTEYKMVPGHVIDKDPLVTVKGGSEDCYLFLKVDESANLDDYIFYQLNDKDWKEVTGITLPANCKVYSCKATKITADRTIDVLVKGERTDDMGTTNNTADDITISWDKKEVAVRPSVTKEMMEAAKTNAPTLTFTAYAVQLYKSNGVEFTAKEAWEIAANA